MIKNIIFDLGGVLITLNRKKCLDAFNDILGFPDFGDYLSAYLQKGFFAEFEDGAIDAAQFRLCVRERSANKEITDEQIDFAVCAFLEIIEPKKVKLLLELKKKYNLYLLSNINPIAWKRSKEMFIESSQGIQITEMFDILFLSYKMKCSKPGKTIFEKVIAEGLNPIETLYIDDAVANTETASTLGFKTLYYDVNKSLNEEVMEVLKANG